MSAISEKVELLGKGLYADIPDQLTLTALPTTSELEYVGAEDFDATMLEKILPQAVSEHINFKDLLEIDFQWICRCLRILNFGPFYTTNTLFCTKCGKPSRGEYRVNLNTIPCKPLPKGFVNDIVISKDEFISFDKDVHIKLPTIQHMINAYKDKAFMGSSGTINKELARVCYLVSAIGSDDKITPVEVRLAIQNELSAADYLILKNRVYELSDYGLRAGGTAQCPNCGDTEAAFIALTDDRFFRPTLGDLREWKYIRSARADKNLSGDSAAAV